MYTSLLAVCDICDEAMQPRETISREVVMWVQCTRSTRARRRLRTAASRSAGARPMTWSPIWVSPRPPSSPPCRTSACPLHPWPSSACSVAVQSFGKSLLKAVASDGFGYMRVVLGSKVGCGYNSVWPQQRCCEYNSIFTSHTVARHLSST